MNEVDHPALFTDEPDREYHSGKKSTWRDESPLPEPEPQTDNEEPLAVAISPQDKSDRQDAQAQKSRALIDRQAKGGSRRQVSNSLNAAVSKQIVVGNIERHQEERRVEEAGKREAQTEEIRKVIADSVVASRKIVDAD